jgi:sugar O-acyltransferase (sialic acid O-acetyltransferase NeuD family)
MGTELTHSRDLLIFPCNGNGLEALDCIGDEFRVIGFVDDTPVKQGTICGGYEVFDRSALNSHRGARVLAVPGSPQSYLSRRTIIQGMGVDSSRFASVIHPRASVSPLARIGRNVLLMAGVVVTANATIGDHVCVLPNTVVHHDVVIGSWSLIGSNVTLAGGVLLGENCYVGSGSSVMPGVRVGDGALVGLGSNVLRDVEAGTRVAGNPARPVPSRER